MKKNSFMAGDPFGNSSNNVPVIQNMTKVNKTSKFIDTFDYTGIDSDVVEELKEAAELIADRQEKIQQNFFEIAENLHFGQHAFASFDKTESKFRIWYEGLGLKKSNVYRLLDKYDIYLLNKDDKKFIEQLPLTTAEALNSKKIDDVARIELIEKFKAGELKTAKEVKEEVKNIVANKNILSQAGKGSSLDIQEAEIVETEEEKLARLQEEEKKKVNELNRKLEKELDLLSFKRQYILSKYIEADTMTKEELLKNLKKINDLLAPFIKV